MGKDPVRLVEALGAIELCRRHRTLAHLREKLEDAALYELGLDTRQKLQRETDRARIEPS